MIVLTVNTIMIQKNIFSLLESEKLLLIEDLIYKT